MDLRTRLVLILVGFSLASVAAFAVFAFNAAESLLMERTERQLDALAEAKLDDLESIVEGWEDRVTLVTTRTELRLSLRSVSRGEGGPAERGRIARILDDARSGSEAIRTLTVYDLTGLVVTRSGAAAVDPPVPDGLAALEPDSILAGGISLAEDDRPLAFWAPLHLEGERVGTLRATLSTRELTEITGDFTGLGDTGETMIALRDSTGQIRVLYPVRFPDSAVDADSLSPENDPLTLAFQGEEGPITEGLVDYRGTDVWAAMRLLPELGWALVVKFDETEEREPILDFRDQMVWVGFSLSAFAILLGILLGLRLAGPIHDLADVANRFREGDLEARSDLDTEDELGLLARTFNDMGEELEDRLTLLHEYKKFFELSPDMLCIAGTDGYFKRVNPAFERTLGWSNQELLNRPFVEFVHPDDVEKTIEETESLGRGVPTVQFRNRYRLPDGEYVWLSWTCHPDPETGLLYAIARRIPESEAPPET